MDNESTTPIDEAAEHAAAAAEQTHEAIEEAVEEVTEDVADAVATHAETAQDAASDAAEVIEDAVEGAVKNNDNIPNDMAEEVYSKVMNQLRQDGVIPSPAMVEEIAGEAIESGVDAPEAVVEPAEIAVNDAVADAARDTISPRREHWYTRPRKFMGREW